MKTTCLLLFFQVVTFLLLLGTCKGEVNVLISTPAPLLVGAQLKESSSALCKVAGMYCPSDHPICCGEAFSAYCVSAGAKCCTSLSGLTRSACRGKDECCAGDTLTKCCDAGSACYLSLNNEGKLVPSCVSDACSRLDTVESCVTNNQCGWCCAENKCKSLKAVVENEQQICVGGAKPIMYGETCPSKCNHARTCKQCLSDYKSVGDDGCTWCCSSMSCIPKNSSSDYKSTCENSQVLVDTTSCGNCMYGGGGVEQDLSDFFTEFFSVLITGALLIVGSFSFIGALRIVIGHCFGLDTDVNTGILIDPQEHVRRHGFQLSDQEASCPATHHHRRSVATTDASVPVVRRCCGCHAAISVETLEDYLPHSAASPDISREPATTAVPVRDKDDEGKHSEREEKEEAAATAAAATTTDTNKVTEVPARMDERPAVLLLPCAHLLCFDCIGVRSTNPADHRSPSISPPAPTTNGTPTTPAASAVDVCSPTGSRSVSHSHSMISQVEFAVIKRLKMKCPVCHKKIVDFVIPEDIIFS